MRRVSGAMFVVLALMLALAQQRPAQGAVINGSVSLDTSGLSGTFAIGFLLTDGSGAGDANNTVTLYTFAFGGGSAGAVLATAAGASGDFATGVTIVDSEFFNFFAQAFTAGTVLTFDFGLTTNVDAGGTPDQFSMGLFQSDGTPIPSGDQSGAVLVVNIDSAQPGFLSFATELTPSPIVTLAANAAEPSTVSLLALALTGALWSVRRRTAVET